jgi:hypothetical protein
MVRSCLKWVARLDSGQARFQRSFRFLMSQRDFYQRFGLKFDVGEARRRFVNRVFNRILDEHVSEIAKDRPSITIDLLRAIHDDFGEGGPVKDFFPFLTNISGYTKRDFDSVLRSIELLWEIHPHASWDDSIVSNIIERAEAPLGITFRLGKFYPLADPVLDEALVVAPLRKLTSAGYQAVANPFEKALRHLIAGQQDKTRLGDAITDSYEALEAITRIVTGNSERLEKNIRTFVSKLGVSDEYQTILKNCAHYAHRFRHSPTANLPRPQISYKEAESFVYLTGSFIRLATT